MTHESHPAAEAFPLSGPFLDALDEVLDSVNGTLDRPKIAAALGKTTPTKIVQEAERLRFDMGGGKTQNTVRAIRKLAKIK